MKKILLCAVAVVLSASCVSQKRNGIYFSESGNQNEHDSMNGIFFEPDAFNHLGYNWDDYIWNETENICCNQISEINRMSMNSPTGIFLKNPGVKKIPVPVCISYYITEKRLCKYSGKEYGLTLFVKKIGGNQNEWLKYPVEKKETLDYSVQEVLAPQPDSETDEDACDKYKSLSDNELDDGYVYGGNLTFNVSDYIDFPLEPGMYEIYVSRNKIESGHFVIEIVCESDDENYQQK